MRWRYRGPGVLLIVLLAGCLSEFGKDGRISKAVHQDTKNLVIKQCSDKRRQEVCGNGQQRSRQCIEECG